MKFHALTLTVAVFAAGTAHANDPKATIADLDARLAKIGAAKIDGKDKAGDKDAPALFFGERKINRNYDVVDAIRKTHNATATVFVKDGEEFTRVSTNVVTPDGKRGVGTQLARHAAQAAVSKGQQFCGPIDVLGTAFDACYNPIKDGAGRMMDEIVAAIRRVSDIVGEISSASGEQSRGVEQTGAAVTQMDQSAQQNAALVEQSAAAAESLKLQAQQLVQAVAVFKLARALTRRTEPYQASASGASARSNMP